MKILNDHRTAPLPDSAYVRPISIAPSGLSVTVYGENGNEFGTFNFDDLDAPKQFVKELVFGFCKATGPEGRWRSKATVKSAASTVRGFATAIAKNHPDLISVSDLSPEMWWAWRSAVEKRVRWPGQINMARALLYEVVGLPDTTLRSLKQRAKKPKSRTYSAYSEAEFRRIRTAAWQVIRKARRRIRSSVEYLETFRLGLEPEKSKALPIRKQLWTRGMLLDHIARTGKFPAPAIPHYHIGEFRDLMRISENEDITQTLFITGVEIYSLMILFVCERGYNTSVLNSMRINAHRADDHDREESIHVVELDKPRRGPKARFFSNSLSGSAARLMRIAEEITQPARKTLMEIGKPSDALFIGRILGGRSTHGTLFRTDWSQAFTVSDSWHSHVSLKDDKGGPLRVTMRRLRLTEQVINQRASQNSDSVSEQVYRTPDPKTHEFAISRIIQGQADAIKDAAGLLAIRSITQEELLQARKNPSNLAKKLDIPIARVTQLLAGALDTATAACTGFHDSPYSEKGAPCPASFLVCLGCKNAISTPDHLPRLVVLHDALLEIAAAVDKLVWDNDYREPFSRLKSLLSQNATDVEIVQARGRATKVDYDRLAMLLNRKLDA